jgi:hypothetical protein
MAPVIKLIHSPTQCACHDRKKHILSAKRSVGHAFLFESSYLDNQFAFGFRRCLFLR